MLASMAGRIVTLEEKVAELEARTYRVESHPSVVQVGGGE